MTIFIVGGTSALAQALVPVLSEFAQVVTAGRHGCDVRLDLSESLTASDLPAGIDVMVNTAAHFGGKRFDDMLEAETVNVLGTLKLCELCKATNIKYLVQISSISAAIDPASPYYSIYSLSKRHADEVARLYASTFGLSLAIVRPSQIYGGEGFRRHQRLLYTILDRASSDEDIVLEGTRDALRNFIHVEDVTRIVAGVIQRKIEGTYACMNPENVTFSQIAAAAVAALRSKSAVRWIADRPDVPDNVFDWDDSLFRSIDDYPRISISQGMAIEVARRGIDR